MYLRLLPGLYPAFCQYTEKALKLITGRVANPPGLLLKSLNSQDVL